ncbi:MAG TPA: class I SAM-dependent methyltransferase [Vicinamibacterales bacterium]
MRDHVVVEQNDITGPRLKYYSRAASVDFWTEKWEASQEVSYARAQRGHLPHQLRDTFARLVHRGAHVLEAGCGLGHFTVAAAALGFVAEGLDWSEPTISRLRRGFPSIPWHVGDVRELPFETGSFDAVYSPGVCEHFEDGPEPVLAETHRVLRPGGLAVVSTPCFNSWLARRASSFGSVSHAPGSEFYEYAFTPEGLTSVLTRIGFDVECVRPYASLDTLVRFANWRIPRLLNLPLAYGMDYVPVVRNWGSTCLWIARRL